MLPDGGRQQVRPDLCSHLLQVPWSPGSAGYPCSPRPASAAQASAGLQSKPLLAASQLRWDAQSLCPGNFEASWRMGAPQVPCCSAWLPSARRPWSPVLISLTTACVPHLLSFPYAPRLSSVIFMKELKAPIRSPPALLSLPQRKQTNPETFGASFWWLRGRGSLREPPRVDT